MKSKYFKYDKDTLSYHIVTKSDKADIEMKYNKHDGWIIIFSTHIAFNGFQFDQLIQLFNKARKDNEC